MCSLSQLCCVFITDSTAGVDYFPVNQSLFIEAGQFSLTTRLQLTPIDDPITEGPEFVIIDYIPVGRSRIEVSAEFPATIVDDDSKLVMGYHTCGFVSTVLYNSHKSTEIALMILFNYSHCDWVQLDSI